MIHFEIYFADVENNVVKSVRWISNTIDNISECRKFGEGTDTNIVQRYHEKVFEFHTQ